MIHVLKYGEIVDCLRESAKSLGVVLKPEQFQVSLSVLEGNDVFANLPTGFGKSMYFQCLPQAFDLLLRRSGSVVLVVCPLVAIMEDQVKDAVRRGLLAAYISCDTAPQTKRSVIEGCYQLVFIGPEMLLSKGWKNVLLHSECFQTKLVTVVFDEAHCIFKWYVTTIMLQFLYKILYAFLS